MSGPTTKILTAHHLPHAVLELIDNAKEYVVLCSAYLSSWGYLRHAVEQAVRRGVTVHGLVREPDGNKTAKKKTEKEIETLKGLGVVVKQLKRLHAKLVNGG